MIFLRNNLEQNKLYSSNWSNTFGFIAFDLSCFLLLYLNHLKLACWFITSCEIAFYVYFFNNDAALMKSLYKWSWKQYLKIYRLKLLCHFCDGNPICCNWQNLSCDANFSNIVTRGVQKRIELLIDLLEPRYYLRLKWIWISQANSSIFIFSV